MFDVRITVIRKIHHEDLSKLYENPISHACELKEGQVFISKEGTQASQRTWNLGILYLC